MNDGNLRPWLVIRQDDNGHRYRIGHCATRAEAQRLIVRLKRSPGASSRNAGRYLVERAERAAGART